MNDAHPGSMHQLPPRDLAFLTTRPSATDERLPDDHAFVQALDLLPHCLAFFDLCAMLLCSNRALRRVLADASERGRLAHEILRFAQELGERVRARQSRPGEATREQVEELEVREVDCLEARYRMRGSRVSLDLFGLGPSVLITLDRVPPISQPDGTLRRSFGLTPAEARVARLLAEGRSNQGISAELHISPHTARHHTQRVLEKLGVRSRAGVGARLRSAETESGAN